MSVKTVAERYSRSLLQLAAEQNKLETIMEDVKTFQKLVENHDFFLMLKSPIIPNQKKEKILQLLIKGKVDDLTYRFLELVIDKGRSNLVPEIANSFIWQYKELKGIETVHITSAAQLSEKTLEDIKKLLKSKDLIKGDIELRTKIDPKLIGGFIVEFQDYIYDASISNRLKLLRRDNYNKNLYASKIIAR